jgi:hypothetical protein
MIGWIAQHGDLAFVCLLHIALHAPTLRGRTSISTSILSEMNRGHGMWAWRCLFLDPVVFTGLGRR